MYVAEGNNDVDWVQWTESGAGHDAAITAYQGGYGSNWFFHRTAYSAHNNTAPNIILELPIAIPPVPGAARPALAALAVLLALLGSIFLNPRRRVAG